MVLVGPNLLVGRALEVVLRRRVARSVGRVLPAFLLPLDAAAVDELDLVVAVVLQRPVRVGREPVVVVAVEHDVGLRRDAALAEKLLESFLGRDVASQLVLQVAPPVPSDGAFDVALLVDRGVDVDLDQAQARVFGMLVDPVRGDERLDLCLRAQFQILQKVGKCQTNKRNERRSSCGRVGARSIARADDRC